MASRFVKGAITKSMEETMIISEVTYKKMPEHIQQMFDRLPNPGSEKVLAGFPQTKSGSGNANAEKGESGVVTPLRRGTLIPRTDHGSAARFFYCAKASRSERNAGCKDLYWRRKKSSSVRVTKLEWESLPERQRAQGCIHPTVKPLALMEYLCKLTMMPTDADLVLDPYMGSGSTLVACARLGRAAVGIDSDEAACEIAAKRLRAEAT